NPARRATEQRSFLTAILPSRLWIGDASQTRRSTATPYHLPGDQAKAARAAPDPAEAFAIAKGRRAAPPHCCALHPWRQRGASRDGRAPARGVRPVDRVPARAQPCSGGGTRPSAPGRARTSAAAPRLAPAP